MTVTPHAIDTAAEFCKNATPIAGFSFEVMLDAFIYAVTAPLDN